MRTKFVIDSIKIALILFLIFGLGYPLLIYGIGQTSMPYQANGEPFVFDNRTMGSMLLYINFGSTAFFSTNNSYYDPYVSVNQAYAEALSINRTARVPLTVLDSIINKNVSVWSRIFMRPVVNVNKLNYDLLLYYSQSSKYKTYVTQALNR
ncbi:MAG: potassium-transporting ATPase subunit C [Nitrososphaerota archaeon]|nr:potassium-transporting ATPase subunit C [Nitrososphaerota archaeon]MDG6927501.1 potassium-transporting ATPase subunit C [Nitrososphaerota archaeon]MDG6932434.1 potassium-transporting ATPase subunit C [Nitrososphaerota archaeon]MDG6936044.1 potassium-transporting ATPase subunit C [Nitrososphaerota archaeon]MDG6943688.1 potassium-transporting ATPase subunit C [Nitrososphaerota archaeon]